MGIRQTIGILFLAAQAGLVYHARLVPERFFCWAPYDEHTSIETVVKLGATELSPKQVNERYRYVLNGWEVRSIHNALNIIEQYETTYGASDSAEVIVTYTTNGHRSQTWRHPRPSE